MTTRKRRRIKRRISSLMQKKIISLLAGMMLVMIILFSRVIYINMYKGNIYSKLVMSQAQQQYDSRVLPAKRGDILDRNGNLLATSKKVYNLILDCGVINKDASYKRPTVDALVSVFGLDEGEILKELETNSSSSYTVLAESVSLEKKNEWEAYLNVEKDDSLSEEEADAKAEKEREEKAKIKGVWFEENYVRTYPFGSLACDVIGFTEDRNTANVGLEGYYNSVLVGSDGRRFGYYNQYEDVEQTIINPTAGDSIVTTLDVGIQQIVEKYVNGFKEAMGSKNIGVIVQNPNTGEILAMDGGDRYDLNDPRNLSLTYDEDEIKRMDDKAMVEALSSMWNNFCVSEAYEPGSVYKPVVVAAGLEKGSIASTEHFYCDGGETFGSGDSDFIQCWVYPGAHGDASLQDIIAESCNDGMMQIGAQMGVSQFVLSQRLFNFGSKTGIDLPNEATGMIHSDEDMGSVELATSTMGQGFTCTMVQEVTALSSVINGGYYYQPRMVSAVQNADGAKIKDIGETLLKQTVANSISEQIREYMEACVLEGTGTSSKVYGYSMGGKTGTAEKYPRGNGKYLVSFIGFAPVENPEVVVYVVVDEANAEYQDKSSYAQYVAQGIFSELLPYLNIQPDEIEGEYVQPTYLWEGFTGHLRDADVRLSIDKQGRYWDEDENQVDSEGNRIDKDGYLLNADGTYQYDEEGERLKTDAEITFTSSAYTSQSKDETDSSTEEDNTEDSLTGDYTTEDYTTEDYTTDGYYGYETYDFTNQEESLG